MITGLQLAMVGGGLVGLGLTLVVWRLVPARPALGDALHRLSRTTVAASQVSGHPPSRPDMDRPVDWWERLGSWALSVFPAAAWSRTPTRELAILRMPMARFYGEKVVYGLLGLAIAPALLLLFAVLGLPVPLPAPVAGSLLLGVLLFWVPNHNARDNARNARAEFSRALSAYVDLVALERAGGAGPRQAMEAAAAVGDSWVFGRLADELARSRWSGQPPWDALSALSIELGLPELDDVANIVRLSGEEGAQIYATLRARSVGMRAAMLAGELAKANEVSERMTIPMSLLGVIFFALLIAPALLRIVGAA